ncbi:ELAV-like protein 2 isoform X2 [Gordionus sp. m RMFG-2023]
MQHKTLKVSHSRPGGDKIKNTNLYVANLPKDIDETKLDNIFKAFGTVIQSRILKDSLGLSRGIGFIRYNYQDEAQLAIETLSGKTLPGTNQVITIKISSDNDKKQKDIIQKYSKVKSVNIFDPNQPKSLMDLESATAILSKNPLAAANLVAETPYGAMMGMGTFNDNAYSRMKQYNQGYSNNNNSRNMNGNSNSNQFTYGMTSYYDIMNMPYNKNYNDGMNQPHHGQHPNQHKNSMNMMSMMMGGNDNDVNNSNYGPNNMSGNNPMSNNYYGGAAGPNNPNRNVNSLITLTGNPNAHKHQLYDPELNNVNMPMKPNQNYHNAPGIYNNNNNSSGNYGGNTDTNVGKLLFVYNIGSDTTEKELINLFWPYGTVIKVDIPKDTKNAAANKGFAFVAMSNIDEANLAIQYLNNFTFKEKPLQVSIKKD